MGPFMPPFTSYDLMDPAAYDWHVKHAINGFNERKRWLSKGSIKPSKVFLRRNLSKAKRKATEKDSSKVLRLRGGSLTNKKRKAAAYRKKKWNAALQAAGRAYHGLDEDIDDGGGPPEMDPAYMAGLVRVFPDQSAFGEDPEMVLGEVQGSTGFTPERKKGHWLDELRDLMNY